MNQAGVIFRMCGSGRYRVETTIRPDLAADRLWRHQSQGLDAPIGGVVAVDNLPLAYRLSDLLVRKFSRSGSFDAEQLDAALVACRRMGLDIVGLKTEPPSERRPVLSLRRVLGKRVVPDPMLTGEEKSYRHERYEAQPRGRPPGYIEVEVNTEILVGGLARVKGLKTYQLEAARDFRSYAEQALIGGARALDYSQARVDTSGQTADMVEANGADARAWLDRSRKAVGIGTLDLAAADRIIVDGQSVTEATALMGLGNGGAARRRVRRAVIRACDALARLYGHHRPNQRARTRADGDKPTKVG